LNQSHQPVLLDEVLNALHVDPAGSYVDATLGAGGHAAAVVARLTTGRLIGLDRDPQALKLAHKMLSGANVELHLSNFARLAQVLERAGVDKIDGALFDLGTSSMQLDQPQRGFSFRADGPLDMRMGPDAHLSAAQWLAQVSERELEAALRRFGEERFSGRIARAIVRYRNEQGNLSTTGELAHLVEVSIPHPARRKARIHPATRTFQAIRIAINDELAAIPAGLEAAFEHLKVGGTLVVIAFHSLEDRPVKQFFQRKSQGCTCPPGLPQCVCNKQAEVKRFPLVKPSDTEIERNPRARSARLRAGRKLA